MQVGGGELPDMTSFAFTLHVVFWRQKHVRLDVGCCCLLLTLGQWVFVYFPVLHGHMPVTTKACEMTVSAVYQTRIHALRLRYELMACSVLSLCDWS